MSGDLTLLETFVNSLSGSIDVKVMLQHGVTSPKRLTCPPFVVIWSSRYHFGGW